MWRDVRGDCIAGGKAVGALQGADCTGVETIVDARQGANYRLHMIEVIESAEFKRWFSRLRDKRAKARIDVRIRRLSMGNPGDVKPLGNGLSEMRIDYGPGYRVYFMRRGPVVVVLLCGGDKHHQQQDIEAARRIAEIWED